MNKGEVWFVEFPLEEDESKSINRPVIVLDENILGVLSVKITKHKARKEDPYDIPIIYWEEASLRLASTARVSKVTLLTKDSFIFKIGNLHPDDLSRIEVSAKYCYVTHELRLHQNDRCKRFTLF